MISNRLNYWMEQKGAKNKYLAKKCGVTEQTFSRWRQNKTQPDLIQAYVVSKTLSISLEDLISEEEEQ